jgi:hypothetical protein
MMACEQWEEYYYRQRCFDNHYYYNNRKLRDDGFNFIIGPKLPVNLPTREKKKVPWRRMTGFVKEEFP